MVTVGAAGDPDGLGPVPANVSVERFVPQAQVLPRCSAVVCHGGSGTVLASLAHGVPVMCLPRGADQFANALNVARVGAGAMLTDTEVTDSALREALDRLVHSSAPRAAAIALSEEIAAMPSDAEVALAVEAHARSL
jgi:UDP:flavonoid glycosyltransferase YjiC (YdhE family)